MTHKTVLLSSFTAYLETGVDTAAGCNAETAVRQENLEQFPYSVMLQLSYPELDIANRWCWQNLGPAQGECIDKYSRYPTCQLEPAHCHEGTWTYHWLVKTEYEFGFCEWYFASSNNHAWFLDLIPSINWGEDFPL